MSGGERVWPAVADVCIYRFVNQAIISSESDDLLTVLKSSRHQDVCQRISHRNPRRFFSLVWFFVGEVLCASFEFLKLLFEPVQFADATISGNDKTVIVRTLCLQ